MSKLTFELQDKGTKLVRDLARIEHTDEADIIERSLDLMNLIVTQRNKGTKITFTLSDGQSGELGDF